MLRAYRIPYSTNVERVALALGHKGLEVEWIDVDPADRLPVREVSGQDLVPVLVDNGRVVADSTAILRYLEETHPEQPLWPREPSRRAELDVFLDWFNRVWKRPPNEIEAERAKPEPDESLIAELGAELTSALDVFEALLDGRDYLYGEFSAADCAAFPFLKYALDPKATLASPPSGRAVHPRVRLKRPVDTIGVKAARPYEHDDEPFHEILREFQPLGNEHQRLQTWVRRVDTLPRA